MNYEIIKRYPTHLYRLRNLYGLKSRTRSVDLDDEGSGKLLPDGRKLLRRVLAGRKVTNRILVHSVDKTALVVRLPLEVRRAVF